MSTDVEIQKLLRKKYLQGPNFKIDSETKTGINYFSGTSNTAYYELWGNKDLYRLVLVKPSIEMFTLKYVGTNHLLFLLMQEDEQVSGGFVGIEEGERIQLSSAFPAMSEEGLTELEQLWEEHVKPHYSQLPLS